jgi:integrase/recombinase XerD
MPSIPRAIPAEQTRKLLASIDRQTSVGRRDYAILLLLARLGLRSGEVAFLELEDIDWDTGHLSVHGKGGQHTGLPLPTDVGKAIAAYLRYGRPGSASRRVFLPSMVQVGWAPSFGIRSSAQASIPRPCGGTPVSPWTGQRDAASRRVARRDRQTVRAP